MLPKFRPAALGTETLARPSIRPVRPSPPPPPPSPPRKISSGFGRKNEAFVTVVVDDDLELPTATGNNNGEPSTLNRGPETVQFEPSTKPTNARRGRSNAVLVSFEDETQARPVDDHLLQELRAPSPPAADLGVVYESLPSLEVRPKYDTYEAEFSERDPATMLHAARESARVLRADASPDTETAYREPPYQEPAYREPS